MQTPYDIIRAIPAKGFDWAGFITELRAAYVSNCVEHNKTQACLTDIDGAKGIRATRDAAYVTANCMVSHCSTSVRFIPPSPETLDWGGFLGGEHVVLTNKDREAEATARIAAMVAKFYSVKG